MMIEKLTLHSIYGFVLGTDTILIVKKMQNMCLVSLHFKKCFIAYYLRSVHDLARSSSDAGLL